MSSVGCPGVVALRCSGSTSGLCQCQSHTLLIFSINVGLSLGLESAIVLEDSRLTLNTACSEQDWNKTEVQVAQ